MEGLGCLGGEGGEGTLVGSLLDGRLRCAARTAAVRWSFGYSFVSFCAGDGVEWSELESLIARASLLLYLGFDFPGF